MKLEAEILAAFDVRDTRATPREQRVVLLQFVNLVQRGRRHRLPEPFVDVGFGIHHGQR